MSAIALTAEKFDCPENAQNKYFDTALSATAGF
jgi:hypothetical protein